MSLFDNARKMIGQARGYAGRNPDKVRRVTDKAARFADKSTQGRYRKQINEAVHKVDGMVHRDHRPGH